MRHSRSSAFLAGPVCLALLALGAAPATAPRRPDGDDGGRLPTPVAEAYEGVVGVRVREVVEVPVFRAGRFQPEPVEGLGAGSGVVISADGLVVTNAHVVARSAEVHVRLLSGREIEARVLSLDEASDLALLRVPVSGLRPIPLADGPAPPAGTPAYVLGNRGDLGTEVAWARIGAHRKVRAGARPLEFWSEVEAPVGPGSSGGALLDREGRLLGIPSLLVSYAAEWAQPAWRSTGLFIPVAHVRRALARMQAGPRPIWAFLGLLLEDPLMARSEGAAYDDQAGVRVRRVLPGSPAEEAGFVRGDRVHSIGPRPVHDIFEALDAVLDLAPGLEIGVEIERHGQRLSLAVTPEARPDDPRPEAADDFTLHTGLRLSANADENGKPSGFAVAALTARARAAMPAFEADLFVQHPSLQSILPGQSALAGEARRLPIATAGSLEEALRLCFVEDQFVALAHWSVGGRESVDKAHVHRKIYPVVL
jgi:S1-C subfamily serine protease